MTGRAGVPGYSETVFAPRRHKYGLCVFVLDEGPRIRSQLTALAPWSERVDIIVADGGSRDGALDDDFLRHNRVNSLLVLAEPPGLGTQMRMAFDFALGRGYPGVVVIDGNDKDDVSALPAMVQALDDGIDHVQGSRFLAGGGHRNTPWLRLWALRLVHVPLLGWAAGYPYSDTTNGFRAYSARLLSHPDVAPLRDVFRGYELHYYLAVRAAELGLSIREVAVQRNYPAGRKNTSKISPVRGNLAILKALAAVLLHRFDPPPRGVP